MIDSSKFRGRGAKWAGLGVLVAGAGPVRVLALVLACAWWESRSPRDQGLRMLTPTELRAGAGDGRLLVERAMAMARASWGIRKKQSKKAARSEGDGCATSPGRDAALLHDGRALLIDKKP
jgi:hypothetical protein